MDPNECVARAMLLPLKVVESPECYRTDLDHHLDGLETLGPKRMSIEPSRLTEQVAVNAARLRIDRTAARAIARGLNKYAGPPPKAPAVPRSLQQKRPANDTRQPMLPGFAA